MFKQLAKLMLVLTLGYDTAQAVETALFTVHSAEDLSNQDGAEVTQDCGYKKDKSWLGTNQDLNHSYLGVRLHGAILPAFSQIVSATLYVTNNFAANQKGALDLEIRAEKSTAPEGFWCDAVTAPSERLTTDSYGNYHSVNNWVRDEPLTVDVTAPLQELLAEDTLGASVALVVKGTGGKHDRKFIYNLQKKNLDPATLPVLAINYEISPPPSNAEALQTFLENLPGFERYEISADGLISVIVNGETHRGQFGAVSVGTPPSDRRLQLLEIGDVNGDGLGDYQFIYPSGDRQIAYYLGIVPIGPPDPATVANPIDPTVASLFDDNIAFLYRGDNPIQTGVTTGTLDPLRVVVIRGRVLTRDGEPLPGVQLTLLHHAEYGQTVSRATGEFDLAVNGGGVVTVNYQKSGYLPVQRTITTPWQDYALLEDVVMIPFDTQVSHIDLSVGEMQVAQSTEITDEDGTRRAILLFPTGTTAERILADGTRQPLNQLAVRATEYTVGPRGPQAMPAELPPTTHYTYAVELSADQAPTGIIEFNHPVLVYIDNFIDIPVGEVVPAGYYDTLQAAWLAAKNGRVIQLLALSDGLAQLDVTGNGTVATTVELAALGITVAEQQQLARLYTVGKTLWRVPVDHFTSYDFNWEAVMPLGATTPSLNIPNNQQPPPDDPECQSGSIINCQGQGLSEQIPLVGTPFTLTYTSERVPGRTAERTLTIPVSFDTNHPRFIRTLILIEIAGRRFGGAVPVGQNEYRFMWDGKDVYGRTLYGKQRVKIKWGYEYEPNYVRGLWGESSFAKGSDGSVIGARTRQALALVNWSAWTVTTLGTVWDARGQGLGGWTLDEHHFYAPTGRDLLLGTGQRRGEAPILGGAITTVSKNNTSFVSQLTVGTDGSIYFRSQDYQISRLQRDGTLEVIAGTGISGYNQAATDNILATHEHLGIINDLKVDADNNLYIAEHRLEGDRVRRIDKAGWLTTIVGGGTGNYRDVLSPNAVSQTATALNVPGITSIALGHQELLIGIDDKGYNQLYVYRLEANGHVSVKATPGCDSRLGCSLQGLEYGPDGTLYVRVISHAHLFSLARLFYLKPTLFGEQRLQSHPVNQLLRELAEDAGFSFVNFKSFTVDAQGILYVLCDYFNQDGFDPSAVAGERLIRVGSDGVPTIIAGTGQPLDGFGDNGAATAAKLLGSDLAVAPDDAVYIADRQRVRRLAPALPGVGLTDFSVAAEDGNALYQFTRDGKHLRTLETMGGTTLYQFSYDAKGYLTAIVDRDGNRTRIERDDNSVPLAIVAADGQRTELTLNERGYLTAVANPAGDRYRMNYTDDGLLTEFTSPRNYSSHFSYDELGRLIHDQNAANGFWALERSEPDNSTYQVNLASALGRTTTYQVAKSQGREWRITTQPDETQSRETRLGDGTVIQIQATGTEITQKLGPDPRFGVIAPVTESLQLRLPSGLTATVKEQRRFTPNPTGDLSQPLSVTHAVIVNDKTTQSVYQAATKTLTTTSPVGRQTTALLSDDLKHVVRQSVSGIEPIHYNYDNRGHLTQVSMGTGADMRTATIVYDNQGYVQSITDALNRQVSFTYDAAGRVLTQTLPDSRIVHYQYDANGNVTSITPPSRPEHLFEYDALDYPIEYKPPLSPSISQTQTQYVWNLDKQLTQIIRPDGQMINFNYNDTKGRLDSVSLPNGTQTVTYDDKGRIAAITAVDGNTLSYSYDGSLPLSEIWSGTVNGSLQLTYNADFQVSSASVNGNIVNYQYDNDGLLTKAGDISLSRNVQNGLLTGMQLGNLTTQRNYNNFGELQREIASFANDPLSQVYYSRDKVGRVIQKIEILDGLTTTIDYRYDMAGRLVEVKQDGNIVETYQYDANGNRLNNNAVYDDQDRLLFYGQNYYTYTANGELLSKNEITYHYDVLGNLRQVQLPDKTIDYVIDARNRRIGKKIDGQLVQGFLYQGSLKPIAELDGNEQIISRFVYGSKANVPDYFLKEGKTYRIVSDHLGSPRLIVDIADGSVVQRMDYDAFGNVLLDTNPGFQPFGFVGGLYDSDTKLVRFGARDYDAEIGRWISKDPIGFVGGDTNLFGYVFGDPINWTDPDGREVATATIGVSTGIWDTVVTAVQGAATGISATGTAIVAGVGLALWPTPVGEGSDIIPAIPSPVEMAKGGKQNVKDSGLINIPTEELEEKLRNPNTSVKEKRRIEKELKGRGERNKRKRQDQDMKRCF